MRDLPFMIMETTLYFKVNLNNTSPTNIVVYLYNETYLAIIRIVILHVSVHPVHIKSWGASVSLTSTKPGDDTSCPG